MAFINFVIPFPMRQVIDPQLKFGAQDVSRIEIDARSRDDIPRILRGLQYMYPTPEVRAQVFAILAEVLPRNVDGVRAVDPERGRPGMEHWKILVLGSLRLAVSADYARIQELANQHGKSRQILVHGDWNRMLNENAGNVNARPGPPMTARAECNHGDGLPCGRS